MAHTDKNPPDENLENRLQQIYRFSVYSLGLVVAAGLIGGTWYGLKVVQTHDQRHAVKESRIRTQVQRTAQANPFRNADKVAFSLPYRHGADPQTLNYLGQLSQHQRKPLSGGFAVPGEYRSGNITQPVDLALACKDGLCQLNFELPARLVLAPRYDNGRLKSPARSFELHSHGFVLAVEQSQLKAVRPETAEQWAPFHAPAELGRYYTERFMDASGQPIKP